MELTNEEFNDLSNYYKGDIIINSSKWANNESYGPREGVQTIDGNVTFVQTGEGIHLENLTITGDLIINNPDSSVSIDSTVMVKGVTVIGDIGAKTLISSGTHSSGIKVTNPNRSHIDLSGNASIAEIEIATSGRVLLVGEFNDVNVTKAGADVIVNSTVNGKFSVEPDAVTGTKVKLSDIGSITQSNIPDGVERYENYDTTPPKLTSVTWNSRRNEMTLTFSEAVDIAPNDWPFFGVSGGGGGGGIEFPPIETALYDIKTLTLTLPPLDYAYVENITYYRMSGVGTLQVMDKAGNLFIESEDSWITIQPG